MGTVRVCATFDRRPGATSRRPASRAMASSRTPAARSPPAAPLCLQRAPPHRACRRSASGQPQRLPPARAYRRRLAAPPAWLQWAVRRACAHCRARSATQRRPMSDILPTRRQCTGHATRALVRARSGHSDRSTSPPPLHPRPPTPTPPPRPPATWGQCGSPSTSSLATRPGRRVCPAVQRPGVQVAACGASVRVCMLAARVHSMRVWPRLSSCVHGEGVSQIVAITAKHNFDQSAVRVRVDA
jgi:hypothetical protein